MQMVSLASLLRAVLTRSVRVFTCSDGRWELYVLSAEPQFSGTDPSCVFSVW